MSKRLVLTMILMIITMFSVSTTPSAAFDNQVVDYQDFYARFQSDVDHFETQMVYPTEHYDENILDLEKAYKELSVRNPAAEFIRTLSAEYHYDSHTFYVNVEYDYDSVKCSELYTAAMKKVDAIALEIFKPGMSDYEKIKAAHDYIVNNVKYDEQGSRDGKDFEYENLFTTAVLDKKAVCGGYSWMLKVLLDRVGIGSQMVIGKLDSGDGTLNGHAWSIVWLKGKPYQVDVTNDDLEVNLPSYRYFMVDDSQLDKSHSWDRSYYPVCEDGRFEYYGHNKLLISDSKGMESLLIERMKDRGKSTVDSVSVVFRVMYPEAFDKKWVEDVVAQAVKQSSSKWKKYRCEYILQGDIRYVKIIRNK